MAASYTNKVSLCVYFVFLTQVHDHDSPSVRDEGMTIGLRMLHSFSTATPPDKLVYVRQLLHICSRLLLFLSQFFYLLKNLQELLLEMKSAFSCKMAGDSHRIHRDAESPAEVNSRLEMPRPNMRGLAKRVPEKRKKDGHNK